MTVVTASFTHIGTIFVLDFNKAPQIYQLSTFIAERINKEELLNRKKEAKDFSVQND